MMKSKWKSLTLKSLFFLICIVLALGMVVNLAFNKANASAPDTYDPILNDHGINTKVSTQAERNASVAAAHEFNVDVEAEGIVLMKNEGNALPLVKGSDVSLFGKNSHHIVYGGSGSSSTGGIYGQRYLSWYARSLSSGKVSDTTGSNEIKITVDGGGELTKAGLNVNKELSDYYSTLARSGVTKNTAVDANNPPTDFSTREPSLARFKTDTAAVASYASAYRDAAILTISRLGGEGFDMPRQFTNTGASGATTPATLDTAQINATTVDTSGSKKKYANSNWADGDKFHHALEPEKQELDMAEYIKKPVAEGGAGFNKLILLVNTGTPMELGALEEYADAIVWIGLPGASGLTAAAQTLVGDVNPSGRFVDTWAKDLIKTPSAKDFGSNLIINEDRDALITGATVYSGSGNAGASTRYQEGIYVGYRYYETRGYAELKAAPDSTWYEDEVAYPFGYGMSYSSGFTWTLRSGPAEASTISKDGTLSFTVRVTNATAASGGVAGKDVVQLYYSAPYFTNGIEKSHVVLGGYAKTGIINPGSNADVTITMKVNDLASYDWNDKNGNGFKGYEVEAGEYKFFLAKNAHAAWADTNTLTRTLNVAAGGVGDFPETPIAGRGANGFAVKTSSTGYTIQNQFDDISLGWFGGAYADPNSDSSTKPYGWSGFQTMSRSDFDGTFPKTPTSANLTIAANSAPSGVGTSTAPNFIVNAAYDTNVAGARQKGWIVTDEPRGNNGDTANNPATQQDIVFADLVGVDKYDDLWEEYLDQFSYGQLTSVLNGYYMAGGTNSGYSATNNAPNLGLSANYSPDGPTGVTAGGNFSIGSTNTCYYLSPIVVASTWNVELAEKLGTSIGNEALVVGCVAIYAPAMNTHRNPFSGRNFEYYSEDGFIAGTIASAVVKGMQSKGLIPNIKHFALNDQDTDRDTVGGLYTWATEQAMREIYLKAFQIPVEEGGSLGVMSAFSRVGATPASDSYPLLTEVLRNEWGFEGYVVTDWYGTGANATGKGWTNYNAGMRAGNDMILGSFNSYTSVAPAETQATASDSTGYRNTHIAAVRKSAHNILFALTRSTAVFRSYAGLVQTIQDTDNVRVDVSSNKALYWNTANHTSGFAVSYRLSEGSRLPAGYKLNASTGIITGTSANFVSFNVKIDTMVTTTGLVGTWRYATMEYTINSGLSGSDLPELQFANETYTGTVGSLFVASANTMTVSTGQSVQSRIIAGDLPVGLKIDSNGLIYGVPTAAGTSTVTVESEIAGGLPLTATITITISDTGGLGKSIVSITKTGTAGLVDTYTITYTDSTTSTFTVTNGAAGATGSTGATGATGAAGTSSVVTIGANGNWYINGADTGEKAVGTDGTNGTTPTIAIGENGNWYVNGADTGIAATGPEGKDGSGCNSSIGIGMGAALGIITLAGASVIVLKKRRKDSSK